MASRVRAMTAHIDLPFSRTVKTSTGPSLTSPRSRWEGIPRSEACSNHAVLVPKSDSLLRGLRICHGEFPRSHEGRHSDDFSEGDCPTFRRTDQEQQYHRRIQDSAQTHGTLLCNHRCIPDVDSLDTALRKKLGGTSIWFRIRSSKGVPVTGDQGQRMEFPKR